MMRAASAPHRRVGLALALLALTTANDAVAQDRPPPNGGGGVIATGGSGGGHSFPAGVGIGIGVGVGLGILGAILSARAAPVDAPAAEGPPRETPGPPPTRGRPHKPPRSRAVTLHAAKTIKPKTKTTQRQGGTPTVPLAMRPGFSVPEATEKRYVSNEILVETKGPAASLRRLEASLGLTPVAVARIGLLDADVRLYRLKSGTSVAATIRALRRQSIVAAAEPNFLFELQEDAPAAQAPAAPVPTDRAPPAPAGPAKPADTAAPVQYAVAALHLDAAHRLTTGADVRVAIIDSGIDETNPNLADSVVDRFDAIGGTFAAQAHGTAMAGAIVAHKTLIGVAPKARLIAIRAFAGASAKATGSSFNVLRGLDFAAAHGARVVNMSFAGPRDRLLGQALEAERSRGIVAIAAAGNGGPEAKPLYPGAEDGIIAVTATDADGKPFASANRGAYIAAAAPGVDVIAPGLGSSVQISTGTSIASAEASGVAALVLALRPHATPDDVRNILRKTARPFTDAAAASGTGLIDAAAAVQAAK